MLKKTFRSRAEWRSWLEKHHDTESEIWLVFYKVKTGKNYLKYNEAVEEALCFGWIDSTVRRIDDEKHMQRYTPRKKGSIWATSNKKRVEKLIKQGTMMEAGLKKIKQAKKDGSWNRLDGIERLMEIPEALKAEFKKNKKAKQAYDNLPDSRKKQFLWWIDSAKRADTRKRRAQETVEKLLEDARP